MRVTIKLVLVFVLGNVLLAALYGYLAVEREVRLFQQTASAEAETLGRAMEDPLAEVWRSAGQQGVLQFVRKANEGQTPNVRIRWVEDLTSFTIQQHMAVESFDADGTQYLRIYWPVAVNAERPCGLEFSRTMTELDRNKREIIQRTAMLIGGMVLLSGLLAVGLGVRFVGTPLRQLTEKTRRVAAGDLEGPVQLHSRDELAELADSLNAMCAELAGSQRKIREESAARIAALEQLRHADRLQTVGRLASGIAHELGTPLNVVSGRAALIASGKLEVGDVGASAAAIKAEADKMTKIIRQLLDFARASTPHKAPIDLRQVVSQTVDLLRPLAEKRSVQLCFAPADQRAIAVADASRIQQVLTNLVMNAVQAMPDGGDVEIALRRQTARPPEGDGGHETEYHCIEIRDHGVGIPADHLEHLFEPFFTTKEVGEGTGLGLSIAYGIVQEHGGWIDVASRPGEGSCFTVFLPEGPQS